MLRIENIILYILLTTTILSVAAVYFHFRRRKTPGALFFSATALSVTIWTIGYIIEFYSGTLQEKFFGVQIQYTFGIPFTAVLWYSASIHLKTFGKRPDVKEFIALLIIPVITMLLIWTNSYHHLIYKEMSLFKDEHFLLIEKEIGLWYYLNMAYSYTALIAGSVILFITIKKSPSVFKGQLIIFYIVAVLPWAANIIYVIGMNSFMRIDITPVAFTISLMLMELASRRYGLFDLVPAAHNIVIESMSNGIVVLDRLERIIEMNPAAYRILGRKDIIGQKISQVLTELGVDISFLKSANESDEVEFGKHIFDVQKSTINTKKGELSGKVLTLYNVTERIKAERELRNMNTSKDKLFSIIAHDLKNPFFGIIGLSNIFCTEYEDLTEEEIKNYAKEINDLAGNTYRILENLLDWSRQQTGNMAFSPVRFDIYEAMNHYIETLEPQAKLKHIDIITEIEEDIFVFADSYMLNTIVRNIISNAVKFSNPGGKIVVSVVPEDNFIKICISDSGVGMDEKTLKNLFMIDQDIKALGTMGERGTGLGLILCKEFVEKNGGQIFVESLINQGSKFYFTIPAAK
nr:histidine kinase N-terminal 7TM domain-containing protein [uncultured Sphaerochaeta sp.]